MKIAFILSHVRISPSNGVVSQALTWKKGLENAGHQVCLVNMWEPNNWADFDVLHLFGFSQYMYEFINGVKKINSNIVLSPILDPSVSINRMKLYSYWGNDKLRLYNSNYCLRKLKLDIKKILVRSEFESKYIEKSFGFEKEKISIVRLSYDTNRFCSDVVNTKRSDFCLHISLLTDERKNVKRLIESARKYGFKLKLAGKLRNKSEVDLLNSWIDDAENIEYLGFLSFDDMIELYNKAKVFVLPSTYEGVGIVGLEAASMGCDIAVTNIGGPKEYYSKYARQVDPFSIDSIGKTIVELMNKTEQNHDLTNYVRRNYSEEVIINNLLDSYFSIVKEY